MTQPVQARAWIVAAMLFLFMLINFADKAVLGLSAVPIMQELNLSHTQFGAIGSSFFAFFSLAAILCGFLVNRVPATRVLLLMALIWALCQLPMLLPVGFAALVANRVVLGLGEGPAYPVALHALFKWFPNERRPVATSLVAIGGAVGAGVVAPFIMQIIVHVSWHAAFFVLGVAGIVWCLAWLVLGREGPLAAEPTLAEVAGGEGRIPYARLLFSRTFVGGWLCGFSAYWLLPTSLTWSTAYMIKGIGFTPTQAGWIAALPALCQIVGMPALCRASEVLKRRGLSSRVSRGLFSGGCVAFSGLMMLGLSMATGKVLPVVFSCLALSVSAVHYSLGHVMVAEITPVSQRGAMLGLNNALATMAGPFAPVLMGLVIDVGADPIAGYRHGFFLLGLFVVACGLVGAVLMDPEADRRRFARASGPVLAAAAD